MSESSIPALLECLHLQPEAVLGFQALSQHIHVQYRQTVCSHHRVQMCADLLRLSKGLVLSSRSGCFCRGVDVFCLCACMATVNRVGIFAWLLTTFEGQGLPPMSQNFSGVSAELNLVCFVLCGFFILKQ